MFILYKKQKNIIFHIFLSLLVLGFCLPFFAKATLAPGIFVNNLVISGADAGKISGEFTVWSNEKYFLPDLNYEIKLFQGTDPTKLQLIDLSVNSETFSVPPEGKIVKPFSYQYPKNIISGDYTVRVQVMTGRGSELGWSDQKVTLKGGDKFLNIDSLSSKVLYNGKEYLPLQGINVNPKEKVTAFLKIKNPGDSISAVPHIKIFNRQFNMALIKEYQGSALDFSKGETKEVKLEMPGLELPESYLAEIKFYNGQDQISGTQYFRWVVKGDGGKILYVKADKDYYKAGENINLNVEYVGPADLSDIGKGKLEITISDNNGKFIAKTSKDVDLNSGLNSLLIAIPVSHDLISPKIEAKLFKDGKSLDDRVVSMPIFSAEALKMQKDQARSELLQKVFVYIALPVLLILILVAVFLVYRFKIRPAKLLLVFLVIFSGLFIGAKTTLAANMELTWNTPAPYKTSDNPSVYLVGGKINFSGVISASGCSNQNFPVTLNAYIEVINNGVKTFVPIMEPTLMINSGSNTFNIDATIPSNAYIGLNTITLSYFSKLWEGVPSAQEVFTRQIMVSVPPTAPTVSIFTTGAGTGKIGCIVDSPSLSTNAYDFCADPLNCSSVFGDPDSDVAYFYHFYLNGVRYTNWYQPDTDYWGNPYEVPIFSRIAYAPTTYCSSEGWCDTYSTKAGDVWRCEVTPIGRLGATLLNFWPTLRVRFPDEADGPKDWTRLVGPTVSATVSVPGVRGTTDMGPNQTGNSACAALGKNCTIAYDIYGTVLNCSTRPGLLGGTVTCGDTIGVGTSNSYHTGISACAFGLGRSCLTAYDYAGGQIDCSSLAEYTALCGDVIGTVVSCNSPKNGNSVCADLGKTCIMQRDANYNLQTCDTTCYYGYAVCSL